MPTIASSDFSIQEFLAQEQQKDLLRFSTAGSVDDGKSTLIGRLLYDTQSVYDDQVRSIEGKGTTAPGKIDFALLTDGLRAEREQGITIDVAYRYFSTARRKFIIADTPGHEQYTRNMATGASTADAAVVLIDASKGVLIQSRRHAYIASLLRVQHVLVAVNKMDIIGYSESVFRDIERDFTLVLQQIAADTGNPVEAIFVPVSALDGDNIVHRSQQMPWYRGPSLLELLESLPSSLSTRTAPFRFPVQRVIRPDLNFRGFAGQIASGTVRPGDEVTIQPSGQSARVSRIVTWDGDLAEAQAPLSVTLTLDRELDISRGDLITHTQSLATVVKSFQTALVWMDQLPLELNRRYLLKHTSHTVPAVVSAIDHRTDIGTLRHESASTLEMNGIGVVSIDLLRPIAIDTYSENRNTGAFILIDPATNRTVAAGMVTEISTALNQNRDSSELFEEPITAEERAFRWGHRAGVLKLSGPAAQINRIERSLFLDGVITSRIDLQSILFEEHPKLLTSLTELQTRSGFLVLQIDSVETDNLTASAEGVEISIDAADYGAVITGVHNLLTQVGFLLSPAKGSKQ